MWAISEHHSGGSPFEYPSATQRIARIRGAYYAASEAVLSAPVPWQLAS